jgi:uncharacterized protein YukE
MSHPQQAYVDPEKLREFADDLSSLARRIRELDKEFESELARLGQTFRDAEYDRFKAHFLTSQQKLARFVDEVQIVVPKLRQDAEDVAASRRVRLDAGL